MSEIIDEILKHLPKGKVSDAVFEGANIVLYTKDKNFFFENREMIREIVNKFKKRIELRADSSLLKTHEETENIIKETIPKDAGLTEILFDPQRSIVVI
nr:beta-CASP ribonuclease aCPSF1 [Nanoarchaeota archaeon]